MIFYIDQHTDSFILMLRFADMKQTAAAVGNWEAANAKIRASDAKVDQIMFVWPLLEPRVLSRIMSMREMSLANTALTIQAAPPHLWSFTREEDSNVVAELLTVANFIFVAKVLIIAKMPETAQQAEASEFLPQPGVSILPYPFLRVLIYLWL